RQGIQNTTTLQIAQKARVSKTTIYKRFVTKDKMFLELIKNSTESLMERIEQLGLDESKPVDSLKRAAQIVMEIMTAEEHVNLLRQLIAEMPRNKALNAIVTRDMKKSVYIPRQLLSFFDHLVDRGLMRHPDTLLAAETFIM